MAALPRIRLVWRLYAIGVAQLLLTAVVAAAIISALDKQPRHWDTHDLASAIRGSVNETDPDKLQQALEKAGHARELALSLYEESDGGAKLVASGVSPPLRLPPWIADGAAWRERHAHPDPRFDAQGELRDVPLDDMPPPHREGEGPFGQRPPFDPSGPMHIRPSGRPHSPEAPPEQIIPFTEGDRAFVLVARFEPGPWRNGTMLSIAFGLVVVLVGSFFTTRYLARPLDRLTQAAKALGAGDLRARTALRRDDELGDLGQAFDEMAERIERLLGAERELLANVSHELRTPLARIHVALDLATEGDADAARLAIQDISLDLAELERLVDDILQATRFAIVDGGARASGFSLRVAPVLPNELVDSAVDRFRAHHPGRPLEVRVEPDLPPLELDPHLVRRVLVNLLENAHKYTPDTALPIEVIARQGKNDGGADEVRFEIVDRGIGVPAADRAHVFEAFYRSDRSRTRGTGGVGLGLTLAKRIVTAHGGRIALDEEPGGGTRASIAFAVAASVTNRNAEDRAATRDADTLSA